MSGTCRCASCRTPATQRGGLAAAAERVERPRPRRAPRDSGWMDEGDRVDFSDLRRPLRRPDARVHYRNPTQSRDLAALGWMLADQAPWTPTTVRRVLETAQRVTVDDCSLLLVEGLARRLASTPVWLQNRPRPSSPRANTSRGSKPGYFPK